MVSVRFQHGNESLWYETSGRGVPLIALHGGLGLDHTYLRPWLDPLAESAELCFLDLLGCGQSSEPADWSTVDHATWIEGVEGLRAHLGWDAPVLFGHSYGGMLALDYALRYPDRVRGLILCGTAASFAHAGEALARARSRDPDRVDAFVGAPITSDELLPPFWETIAPLYFHAPSREMFASLMGTRMRAGATNRSMRECLATYDVRARLGEIRVPTLVLAGAHDFIVPPEPCASDLGAIRASEVVTFAHSGHCPFMEEQARFLAVVTAWLGRLERA